MAELQAVTDIRNKNILHEFTEIAQLNLRLEADPRDLETSTQREEVADRVRRAALGAQIIAKEMQLDDADRTRPIRRYHMISNQISLLGNDMSSPSDRRHEGNKWPYGQTDPLFSFYAFPKQVRGSIVGIDAPNNSLVIRPNLSRPLALLLSTDRFWVEMVNTQGEPLVEVAFL